MGIAQPVKRFTPEDYYRLERDAAYKSDYYDGEIFAMAAGSARYSLICTNITGELRERLKTDPCIAYESNLRLKIKATGLRTYPDANVYCGPMERDDEDPSGETYINPTVLFEVLSKSTEASIAASNRRTIGASNRCKLISWYHRKPITSKAARGVLTGHGASATPAGPMQSCTYQSLASIFRLPTFTRASFFPSQSRDLDPTRTAS